MIIEGLFLFTVVTGAQVLLARAVADKLTLLASDAPAEADVAVSNAQ